MDIFIWMTLNLASSCILYFVYYIRQNKHMQCLEMDTDLYPLNLISETTIFCLDYATLDY